MDLQDRRAIRNKADQALAAAANVPRKLALLYAGGSAVLSLVCSVIVYLVNLKIDTTGGLGNMGLRSVLSTIATVLPLALSIFTIFLGFGYQSVALRLSRRQVCAPETLLDGFRRFGPLLRLVLLESIIYTALAFLASYAGVFLFLMTPLANDFMEIMLPLVSSVSALNPQIAMDEATYYAMIQSLTKALPFIGLVLLLLATPIFYQFRMAVFALFDAPNRGALAAMKESRTMMKGNRFKLFLLDLRFWWFYLAEVLLAALAYADVLLPTAGIVLPWSDTVSYFLFYALSLALQTGLYYLFLNQVHVTYATAYEILKPEPQEPKKVPLGNIFDLAKDYRE